MTLYAAGDPRARDSIRGLERQGFEYGQPLGKFDAPSNLVTSEVLVCSHDGAMVPLSIIHKREIKLDGANPTLLTPKLSASSKRLTFMRF